jgi:spoIIIJ-associated protein
MIRARKYAGKTVDEATEIALDDLDAELEDVEIKVVSTGRSGILGFGGEPAEIEISLLSDGRLSFSDDFDEEAVADSPEESAESVPRAASADSQEATPRNRGRSRNRSRGRGRRNRDGYEEQQPEAVESSSEAPAVEATDEEKPSNGRRGRRGARGDRDAERLPSSEHDERPEAQTRPERDDRPQLEERSERPQRNEDSQPIIREKDEEAEQLVSELIDYFLGAMGVVAETYIREDDDDGSMTFEIEGQDAGLLIGRRGETLQALQFLIRMVTNRQLGRKAYVVIDIEDYRERRTQMLRRLARRTAGRVASSGRDDSLDPMSPAERRIVHMALAGHPEVRTESEGEGNQRRVVIFPTD